MLLLPKLPRWNVCIHIVNWYGSNDMPVLVIMFEWSLLSEKTAEQC